ncbi:MAG TPA: hypothetical protein VF092_03085 [Longimicrobium sp.]
MKIHPLLPAVLALLLAISPVAAQTGGAAQLQPGAELLEEHEQRPLETLMEVRRELNLTDAQMARLQQIAVRLNETNRPLREELFRQWQAYREERRAELLRMTPEQRQAELARIRAQGRPPVPPELRPLVQRIRGNIAGAMREAGTVLTPQQKARARELVRARGGRMGPGRPGRGAPGRPGMGRRGRVRAGRP